MSNILLTSNLILEKAQQKKRSKEEAIIKEKYEYLVKKLEDYDLPIEIETREDHGTIIVKAIVDLLDKRFPSKRTKFCYTYKCTRFKLIDIYDYHVYEINIKRNNICTIS